MKFLQILVLFSLSINSIAQTNFDHYQTLQGVGALPEVFTQQIEDQIENHKAFIINKGDKFNEKREKKQFALKASYHLKEMVLNGQVLFGDALSKYVIKVGDGILGKVKLKNKDKIEFFVVKSPYVNAFTTDEGKIFISTGLVAQLETEAQLAFILCHEIAHFQEKHVLDGFLHDEKVEKEARYVGGSAALLKKSVYSQKNELEADKIGLDLFLKTEYNTASVIGVFDILQFSHLPIDDVKYNPSYLEGGEYTISKKLLTDSIPEIKPLENKENSTHPSSEKRLSKIEKLLKDKNKGGKHNLLGEAKFKEARNIARFELTDILIKNNSFTEALYNNFIISQDFKDSYYVDYTNAQALYYLSKYKQRYRFVGKKDYFEELAEKIYRRYRYNSSDDDDEDKRGIYYIGSDKIQGESFKLFNMVEKMGQDEFTFMSVNYIWNKYTEHNDEHFKKLAAEIFKEVTYELDVDSSKFQRISRKAYLAKEESKKESGAEETEEKGYKRSSKYKKIENKIDDVHSEGEDGKVTISDKHLIYFAFVEKFKTEEFNEMFDDVFAYSEWRKEKEDKDKEEETKKSRKELMADNYNGRKVFNANTNENLGLKSLIYVDPVHVYINNNRKEPLRILTSADKQRKLSGYVQQYGRAVGLDIDLLDSKNLKSGDTEKFNELVIINNMIKELQLYGKLDSLVLTDQTKLKKICDKYGTNSIAWNSMVSVKDDPMLTPGAVIAASIFVYPLAPYWIYAGIHKERTTHNYFYVFDVEKGELTYKRKYKIKSDSNAAVKQNIYHNLEQIKKAPKN